MKRKQLIYENPLTDPENLKDFVMEGHGCIDYPGKSMRMRSALDQLLGQKANYVLWCKETFPENIEINWEFRPITDHGLCIMFFAAAGRNGADLFAESLTKRTGEYSQYHSGDINTFHISYFRRKEEEERLFHTCNLRKSYGFHLVAQGADPLPGAKDARDFYRMSAVKCRHEISFSINGLTILRFEDDGVTYGNCLGGGKIGFRQLAPLTADYRNLKVYEIA